MRAQVGPREKAYRLPLMRAAWFDVGSLLTPCEESTTNREKYSSRCRRPM